MLFYFLLCNTLFIPLFVCSNTTISKSEVVNKILNGFQQEVMSNRTEEPSLSADNRTVTDGNAINKTKVVARKGVVYPENITKAPEPPSFTNKNIDAQANAPGDASNNQLNETIFLMGNDTMFKKLTMDPPALNKTEKIRKHLMLIYGIAENQTDRSSPQSLMNNQYPLTNKNANSHAATIPQPPRMIMPIIITILLVPMFGVLGYMVLRRGAKWCSF